MGVGPEFENGIGLALAMLAARAADTTSVEDIMAIWGRIYCWSGQLMVLVSPLGRCEIDVMAAQREQLSNT